MVVSIKVLLSRSTLKIIIAHLKNRGNDDDDDDDNGDDDIVNRITTSNPSVYINTFCASPSSSSSKNLCHSNLMALNASILFIVLSDQQSISISIDLMKFVLTQIIQNPAEYSHL